MARPAKPAPESALQPINDTVLRQDLDAATALGQQITVIDEQYGDAVPYDLQRLIHETRFYLSQSAEAMLEAGRRLILIKEHEPHGLFLDALHAIGIDERTAQRFMRAALRFGDEARELARLGRTKLYELAYLDDEEIDALREGGTVAGLSLDDIDRMSVAELRTSLRKMRHDAKEAEEMHERQLLDKNRKIDDLARALARRDRMPPEDRVQELVGDIWHAVGHFLPAQEELRAAFDAVRNAQSEDAIQPGAIYTAQCQALVWLMQRLEDIRREFHLYDVSPLEPVSAPWEAAPQDAQAAESQQDRAAA
jgi:hypothetical protein